MNITLGEPPGFLHSWGCVFWDLYCAAPERRETCDHSSEAKAFHDYNSPLRPSPPNQSPGTPGPTSHGWTRRPWVPTHGSKIPRSSWSTGHEDAYHGSWWRTVQ